ncbi:MAG: hypothetical protein ACLPUO_14410 [Streptosporangiaceae bacterium]
MSEVAERYGVARQKVHRWMAQYWADGLPCAGARRMHGAFSVVK